LITEDPAEAEQMAEKLNALNRSRQQQTREWTLTAETMALEREDDAPLLLATHQDFPPGIVGLIASRLVENHYRPAVIAHVQGEKTVGSCRSIPEFHITDALDHCTDLLMKHGGHAAAAGFTVRNENLPALCERLTALAREQLADRVLVPKLTIDAELELGDLVFIQERRVLDRLEPCGYGNSTPLFRTSNVRVVNPRRVGRDSSHLKLALREGNRFFDAIAFRMGEKMARLEERMDIVYYLEENEWSGRINLQLNIQDMRPAGEETR
jgi:single-stranded-DNA-specific exonuclease